MRTLEQNVQINAAWREVFHWEDKANNTSDDIKANLYLSYRDEARAYVEKLERECPV